MSNLAAVIELVLILIGLGFVVWAFVMLFSKKDNAGKSFPSRIWTFLVRVWDAISGIG